MANAIQNIDMHIAKSLLVFIVIFPFLAAAIPAVPGLSPINGSLYTAPSKCPEHLASTDSIPDGCSVVVNNMPPVRSQDGLGVCYSCAAAALIENYNCEHQSPKQDCTKLTDDQRPSMLDLSRFSVAPNLIKNQSDPNGYDRQISERPGNYASYIIENIARAHMVARESCAPFAAFVNKISSSEEFKSDEKKIWTDLHAAYDHYQAKKKECSDCAKSDATVTAETDKWHDNYGLATSKEEELAAFNAETYEEFLSQFLVPKECRMPGKQYRFDPSNLTIKNWPLATKESDYTHAIDTLKKALINNHPVALDVCLLNNPNAKCIQQQSRGEAEEEGGHSLTITGYKKLCNSKGCKECIKVQNCWGQGWQEQNADGWVDAKVLLDKTMYSPGSMTWLEDH